MNRKIFGVLWFVGGLSLIAASACATTGEGGQRRNSGPISRAELDSVNAFMVPEAIDLLRPNWMPTLQGGCYEEQGMDMDALARLPLSNIREIQLISPSEAASRCGIGGTAMMASGRYLMIYRIRRPW
jgi:hypothetical protein